MEGSILLRTEKQWYYEDSECLLRRPVELSALGFLRANS